MSETALAAGRPPGRTEFVALIAMLFAMTAISIDAMLPALPDIAARLTPDNPNLAQLVVTSFVFGMGVGTLFAGPLSDAFGRKPVILWGALLYCAAALVCHLADTIEVLLAARIVQGIGAAAPRVVPMAMVRDLYRGRAMAQLISYAMMVFALAPAVAPMMGTAIIALAGWPAIYLAYIVFAVIATSWVMLRQPETLAPPERRPLSPRYLVQATREVLSHRVVVVSILCQSLTLGMLFATLSSVQGIFEITFESAATFPYWFAAIAVMAMSGSFINARIVMRAGMRPVATATYGIVVVATVAHLGIMLAGPPAQIGFVLYIGWSVLMFAMMGLTMGNLNALAMEPLGHIAGAAASVISAIATVLAVPLAIPVGLAFDGTPQPLIIGTASYSALCLLLMLRISGTRRPF